MRAAGSNFPQILLIPTVSQSLFNTSAWDAMATQVHDHPKAFEDTSEIQTVEDSDPVFSFTHQEYLIQRHRTYLLDPMPSVDAEDPLDLPNWRVMKPQRFNCT